MQLPRGTFREIKKGITVSTLLGELERIGFSGVCSFSYGESTGTLVFKSGKEILAKFLNKNGDAAWGELQKILGEEVDAALSTLDEAQIQLSLEFNKSSRLVKSARGPPAKPQAQRPGPLTAAFTTAQPARQAPPSPPVLQKILSRPITPAAPPVVTPERAPAIHPPVPAQRIVIPSRPAPLERPPERPSPVQRIVMPSRQVPVVRPPPVPLTSEPVEEKTKPEPEETTGSERSSFDDDIDSFDAMDIENVTAKLRLDCKTMIKQLNLEHLIER